MLTLVAITAGHGIGRAVPLRSLQLSFYDAVRLPLCPRFIRIVAPILDQPNHQVLVLADLHATNHYETLITTMVMQRYHLANGDPFFCPHSNSRQGDSLTLASHPSLLLGSLLIASFTCQGR